MKPTDKALARNLRTIVDTAGRPIVQHLYAKFDEFNRQHFDGKLGKPKIMLDNTGRALGTYQPKDIHGIESRITVRKSLSTAEATDVLLHEMIHAWQHEVVGDLELGYRGHGPIFATKANEIGAKLGLPTVGVRGRDGKPDCKYWPQIVKHGTVMRRKRDLVAEIIARGECLDAGQLDAAIEGLKGLVARAA